MRSGRLGPAARVAAFLLAAVCLSQAGEKPGDFDFYVLSLSWSPSYCEAEGAEANRDQCAAGRPYAFVVHGLWPQYERGFPRDCPTTEPTLPGALIRSMLDIMPAGGLVVHEWRAHGACTGLTQQGYFDALRRARARVTIPSEFGRLDAYRTVRPAEVEKAFLAANPGMKRDGTSVTCDRRFLREVRICMTRDLRFRACPELEKRACRLGKAVMPPVRGGS